ncbi:MAG TPA: LuxR family transcriptional regulator [Casimicrobiaceae bacterium]|jgi:DNA-binding CsgD family transcriptional regulator
MYGKLKPGRIAHVPGTITTPHIALLIEAKRRNEPLEPVVLRVMNKLGFDSFMYGMSPDTGPLSKSSRGYVWTTLPLEWVRRYSERGYVEVDPRVTETYNRNLPFVWDAHDYLEDPRCASFFKDSTRYGVCSGVAISFRDPDHGRILCAFNSSVTPVDGERRKFLAANLGEMMVFSVAFHDLFMAHYVDNAKSLMLRLDPLSKRERQCLELAAKGLTSIDIGSKLGIAERTANFHFNNLIQKMGVLNRQEAIAVGIARGWVRLDSASLNSGCRPVGRNGRLAGRAKSSR